MFTLFRRFSATAITSLFVLPLALSAANLVIPPGISPGEQYRIVFVTSTVTTAFSSNIDDYNDFVNNTAHAGSQLGTLPVSWKAIASTQALYAIDNIGALSILPIFLLDGTLVANGVADLFDGAIQAAISLDENGNAADNDPVWTGTQADGQTFSGGLGTSDPLFGRALMTDHNYLTSASALPLATLQMYGISDAITATPEPSLSAMVVGGLAILAAIRNRRCRA
jgi:hypothetical protein